MSPDLQRWWLQSHWFDLHWIEADLTIWIEQITERNKKDKQRRTKTTNNKVTLRRRNHEIKSVIDVKITYFNKRKIEKRVRVKGVILGQKLTLNHPSLVDEGEKTRVLVMAHKTERGREKGGVIFLQRSDIWCMFKLCFWICNISTCLNYAP